MLKVYGIKNCDTMKKAFVWLEANGVAYEFIDYKKAGVAAGKLPEWCRKAGWQVLLNTRGLMWKKLSEAQRADVDEAKAIALMGEYPSLIKRPLIEHGDQVSVGFDAERFAQTFKS
ncbi:MAG: arsenate reductase [Azospira sp.]|jgi:arsenate reductase|uniref:Arsenate reductase n=1 Tax=Azospira oryzae TaxID=146939 RepID=A0ABY0IQP0_9RHOO|nr:arsenate reductase [Azospira oryzae]MBP7488448.1 arsenate reductase [Azospira sp.]RZT89889.1 arsenate reductase [Azospira oryzae]TLS19731.1 MAG: arsenate reductase [Betaproteobacteria bacterium]